MISQRCALLLCMCAGPLVRISRAHAARSPVLYRTQIMDEYTHYNIITHGQPAGDATIRAHHAGQLKNRFKKLCKHGNTPGHARKWLAILDERKRNLSRTDPGLREKAYAGITFSQEEVDRNPNVQAMIAQGFKPKILKRVRDMTKKPLLWKPEAEETGGDPDADREKENNLAAIHLLKNRVLATALSQCSSSSMSQEDRDNRRKALGMITALGALDQNSHAEDEGAEDEGNQKDNIPPEDSGSEGSGSKDGGSAKAGKPPTAKQRRAVLTEEAKAAAKATKDAEKAAAKAAKAAEKEATKAAKAAEKKAAHKVRTCRAIVPHVLHNVLHNVLHGPSVVCSARLAMSTAPTSASMRRLASRLLSPTSR